MYRNRLMLALGLLIIASMVLAACQPAPTATPAPVQPGQPQPTQPPAAPTTPPEPKVMVVCMAQEPSTLYSLSESALVTAAVLEAVNDFGVDTRSYSYQAVGLTKLPNFDDGDATQAEVEVTIGDKVYDAASDEVVEIAADSVVSLNQLDGTTVDHDFATSPVAKTVQLSVTWTLVDGMTWEDGTPVTTKDVLFSWNILGSVDTPRSKYTFDRTASYTAVDDKSWTWVSLPGYTTGTYFADGVITPLPSHVYGEGGARPLTAAEMLQDEQVNRDPLAFGPFKVVEWVAGSHIRLEKNATYYRASEGMPKLDTLIFRFVPDSNQLIAQLASGECDLGTQDAAFEGSLPLIRQFEAEGLLIPQVVAGTVFEHLDFNITPLGTFPGDEKYGAYTGFAGSVTNNDGSLVFSNADVRKAIAHCIDRQAVVDGATNGAAVVQHTYTASDHPLYAGDANITLYEFNPQKGLDLLAALGWTDTDGDGVLDNGQGQKFSFIHSTRRNPLREKVTQIVQQQLKTNCKLETKIELFGSEYFADGPTGLVFGRQYDMGEFAWLTGVEPPCNLYTTTQLVSEQYGWGSNNNVGFQNAAFDTACSAALNTLDETVKATEHGKAQKIFTDFLPSIPLFARAKILVTRPEVVGVIMDPTANSELWNVENFDLVTP